MKKILFTLFLAFVAFGTALQAADLPRTLTPEFYVKKFAHRGPSKTGWIWSGPSYDRTKGVSWDGRIDWKAADRNSEFLAGLEGVLKQVARKEGVYSLIVSVVQAELNFSAHGDLAVEFAIRDAAGEIVAMAHEYTTVYRRRSEPVSFASAADTIVGNLERDLLK